MQLPDAFDFIHCMDNNLVYHASRDTRNNYLITWFSPINQRNRESIYKESDVSYYVANGSWIITSGAVEEDINFDLSEVI